MQLQFSLPALQHNLRRVRQAAPHSQVLAMLKANAYGHGLLATARCLAAADGFAIARIEEAAMLRAHGIKQRLVLLAGPENPEQVQRAAQLHLDLVIHAPWQLELLEQTPLAATLALWLKFDTGMHRLGLPPALALTAHTRLRRLPWIGEIILMTHLAASDLREAETTPHQLAKFAAIRQTLPGLAGSVANSGGILAWPESHLDWVRPGIMLYGVSPFAGRHGAQEGLQPVMSLSSTLLAVIPRQAGDRIGYGGMGYCPEDLLVGVAAIGYGDGYPRQASNCALTLVNGLPAPILGRVSMDLISLDLRASPGAQPGDTVLLWGAALPVEQLATVTATIAYELLCHINPRAPELRYG